MNISLAQAYSEVDAIINLMDIKYREKIPKKLLNLISENKDNNNIVNFNIDKALDEQNISPKALAILAVINYNYWCTDEKEKSELIKRYYINEEEKHKKSIIEHNPYNLFENIEKNEDFHEKNGNNQLIIYNKKENFFVKVINKIRKWFN